MNASRLVGDSPASNATSGDHPERVVADSSFREGPIADVVIRPVDRHTDERGWLAELFRQDELPAENIPLMAYVSETLSGVSRGPHEHLGQSDMFAFVGPGDLKLYLWDARKDSSTSRNRQVLIAGESNAHVVIIPPGVVHAYKNIGDTPAWVINLPNRLYAGQNRQEPVDEIRYEDQDDHPYVLD